MAQFGIHALIGLWIAWSLPLFSPYVLRLSFGAGIYIGSVLPDIDIYASAVAYFIKGEDYHSFHRSLTHSVIIASFLLFLFLFLDFVVSKRYGRRQASLIFEVQEIEEDEDALLSLNGALSSQERALGINFRGFGIGLFIGMLLHIFMDIIFWFQPVDILYPLPLFGIGNEINAWRETKVSENVNIILSLSELFIMAMFFVILRVSVVRRLGKWANMPDGLDKRIRTFTDNDIEHSSMDFSLHADSDICPIEEKTLQKIRPTLLYSRIIIIFQFLYFLGSCMCPFIKKDYVEIIVFSEIMFVCIPAFFYFSWMLKDVIMRKSY